MVISRPAFSLVPKDRVFFDLFAQAGGNSLRAAKLLQEMIEGWPDSADLAREILLSSRRETGSPTT